MSPSAARKLRLYFAVFVLSGYTADAAEIRLKTSCDARDTFVTLAEVAQIAGSEEEMRQLGSIRLFPSPPVGRERLLRASEVSELLRLHDFDSERHRVTGDPVRIRGHRVREARPGSAMLPPSSSTSESAGRQRSGAPRDAGERPTAQAAPVASRPAPPAWLIRRGDMTTVVARSPGVEVRTQARALGDGVLGEVISLETADRKDRYLGRVSGWREVEVYASGTTVERTATYTRPSPGTEIGSGVRVTRRNAEPTAPVQ